MSLTQTLAEKTVFFQALSIKSTYLFLYLTRRPAYVQLMNTLQKKPIPFKFIKKTKEYN